jgi:hypothetical protein
MDQYYLTKSKNVGQAVQCQKDFDLPAHWKHSSEVRFPYSFLSWFFFVLVQKIVLVVGLSDIQGLLESLKIQSRSFQKWYYKNPIPSFADIYQIFSEQCRQNYADGRTTRCWLFLSSLRKKHGYQKFHKINQEWHLEVLILYTI